MSLFSSSYPTLKILSEKRPDVPIYVGNTSRPVFWSVSQQTRGIFKAFSCCVSFSVLLCDRNLEQSEVQLTNINVVPFGVWVNVSISHSHGPPQAQEMHSRAGTLWKSDVVGFEFSLVLPRLMST